MVCDNDGGLVSAAVARKETGLFTDRGRSHGRGTRAESSGLLMFNISFLPFLLSSGNDSGLKCSPKNFEKKEIKKMSFMGKSLFG